MTPFYSRKQTSLPEREDEMPYLSSDFFLLSYRPRSNKRFVCIVYYCHEVVMRDTESQNTVKFEFEHFLLQRIFRSIRSEQNKTRPNLYERKLIGAK